ncbi:molecular chaperone HtpG [Methylobrevis pamukkalensis]|uniref:Chaperone protein HtpG n=1 Tax=Methylobrevis pamukkalensis TaxID=1439726 RepID=A0A1E3H427_9HYPH|nr:molecular chaperone HtpG [Methylobrevis pamukkalensis]ODN70281.1 Chaperone protein HtpG [Methylobrevis pamukkalensis]
MTTTEHTTDERPDDERVDGRPDAGSAEPSGERHVFEAEVSRLLHLMVHAVYSNKDVFLRELVSNAADACEKLRYLSVAEPGLIAGQDGFRILIEADPEAHTLSVVDNGIGMTRAEMKDNLGTIARSGTRAFLDQLTEKKDGQALIGQFGVGFYSAFMVADRVRVVSRRAGSDVATVWTSDGQGSFELAELGPDAELPPVGTRVTLALSKDAATYAEAATVERIVREYSAHVPVPIVLRTAGEDELRELTDGAALWVKPKSAVTPEEYKDFYGHVGGMWDEPALTVHYRAEGRHEYSVLLFVPSSKPFDLFDPDRRGRVKLYVRRVFIADDAELLPAWLRFLRGVVDSEDLPLNISREMLQQNPVLEAIGKGVTSRVLSELAKLAEADPETFTKVWEAFGAVLKEGLYEAPERRDELFRLARFRTTTAEGWRSLSDYVASLKTNQTAIYYALGDSREAVLASPQLEGYKARGLEVLLLTDPVDAFWVRTAIGFDGKPFRSVSQGAADLDQIELPEGESADGGADVAGLALALKEALGDKVTEVRASSRLATSAVCLVAPDFGLDRRTEKLMSRGDGRSLTAPVLEINPRNGLIKALAARQGGAGSAHVADAAHLLYAQARILDGDVPDDPADFAARLGRLMESAFAG